MAPAFFKFTTTSAFSLERKSLRLIKPVAFGMPLTLIHSLQENGTPSSGAFFTENFSSIVSELKISSTCLASFKNNVLSLQNV